jgi:hypothetical protein
MDSSGTHLNDAEVWLLASFIYRDLGYPFYPVLNGVCDVWDNLANDGFIKTLAQSNLVGLIHLHCSP